jgi:hypothetical protein
MAKSQPDFSLRLSRPGGRKLVILAFKEAAFKIGQTVAPVLSGGAVVFNAIGPNKPEFSFACVDGDEVVKIRRFVMNSRTGRPFDDVSISWVGRRSNETIAYRCEECTCGEGGGTKTSEGDGFTAEANFKFLPLRVMESVNGGRYVRAA